MYIVLLLLIGGSNIPLQLLYHVLSDVNLKLNNKQNELSLLVVLQLYNSNQK